MVAKRAHAAVDADADYQPQPLLSAIHGLPVFMSAHDGSVDVTTLPLLLPSADAHSFGGVRVFVSSNAGLVPLLSSRRGSLYVATDRLYWFCQGVPADDGSAAAGIGLGLGIAARYPALLMHAVSQDVQLGDGSVSSTIYCQLDLGQSTTSWSDLLTTLGASPAKTANGDHAEDDDDEDLFPELWIVPDDQGAVEAIYQALSTCAALHPDESLDQDEDEEDDDVMDLADLTQLQEHLVDVDKQIAHRDDRKSALESEIARLQADLDGVQSELTNLRTVRGSIKSTLDETEANYQKIVASSQALLQYTQRMTAEFGQSLQDALQQPSKKGKTPTEYMKESAGPHDMSANNAAVVADRWIDATPWYNGPFVFGAAVTLEVLAIGSVSTTLLRKRTRFYQMLLVTLLCAFIDLIFNGIFGSGDRDTVRDAIWCLASWCGVCGFNVNSYSRLGGLMGSRHRRSHRALGCLVVVPILLYTLYTFDTLWIYNTDADNPLGTLGDTALVGDVWSIVDATVSATLSACFVYMLQEKTRDGIELCHGYNDLLFHVKVMLSVEATLIVVLAAVNIASPSFDPLLLTFYFAEAFRYLIYSRFLHNLNTMMCRPRDITVKSDFLAGGARKRSTTLLLTTIPREQANTPVGTPVLSRTLNK
ncbi:hypothetical protein RI367_005331 [Sorochytrium milnesiophthora]